ncbi:DUF2249 domain-containing protein [Adhaeribacter soli]|uniref:DUF2249 domain-containing protein n=1 Tax=Adhaeribacter soli TaxID=2607655 RepID=A0A5N1IKN9_9BACT|nr:DUF2249 domain-containing protein [Adhaeribacter soli]KAA9325676.1 DUF2249 domain-containing protein [Adhaeribacter soli]
MKISSKTKISALIKENPKAIDAIASINPHFEKLRNPILRKVLASRVTIADAARIGNASVADFFVKLQPLGFEPENDSASIVKMQEPTPEPSTMKPSDLPEKVVKLDVREDLATGNDPFNLIMDALGKLEPNQALLILNTFEPTPLFSIVAKRGFTHYVENSGPGLVHTYLYKTISKTEEKVTEKPAAPAISGLTFPEALEQFEGRLQEVDVRDLEMPLPMMTILETLPKLKENEALFVHHRRVPQYLLPQLSERGFAWSVNEASATEVKLLIYKI